MGEIIQLNQLGEAIEHIDKIQEYLKKIGVLIIAHLEKDLELMDIERGIRDILLKVEMNPDMQGTERKYTLACDLISCLIVYTLDHIEFKEDKKEMLFEIAEHVYQTAEQFGYRYHKKEFRNMLYSISDKFILFLAAQAMFFMSMEHIKVKMMMQEGSMRS
jgi:hypothetical protein